MTIPTPDEIDAALASLKRGDDGEWEDLWEASAYDAQGQFVCIGLGYTPAEARAMAWITACGWDGGRVLPDIPRHVPKGWVFIVHEGPLH
jgi:hypothetical protein